jgi:hypothetical protein
VSASRVRAASFTVTGLLLSAAAHAGASGGLPRLVPVAAVAALSMLCSGVLGRVRRGPFAVSAAMVVLQVGSHIALSGGHHVHWPSRPMATAHLAAAVALACWLCSVDRALARRISAVLRPLVVPTIDVPRQRVAIGAGEVRTSFTCAGVPGRGPPAAHC